MLCFYADIGVPAVVDASRCRRADAQWARERPKPVKIQNIELLAKQIVTINDGSVSELPKTVGLVSLNVDSKKGHFVDIWTMILAKGHPSEGHTQAEVNCQIRSK